MLRPGTRSRKPTARPRRVSALPSRDGNGAVFPHGLLPLIFDVAPRAPQPQSWSNDYPKPKSRTNAEQSRKFHLSRKLDAIKKAQLCAKPKPPPVTSLADHRKSWLPETSRDPFSG